MDESYYGYEARPKKMYKKGDNNQLYQYQKQKFLINLKNKGSWDLLLMVK